MKCKICKLTLRKGNKSGVCSNCGNRTLRSVIKDGTIKLETLSNLK